MMALDPKIEQAIKEAVANADQSPALARKLIAWLNAVVSGNEDLSDSQSAQRHLDLIYDETKPDISAEEF